MHMRIPSKLKRCPAPRMSVVENIVLINVILTNSEVTEKKCVKSLPQLTAKAWLH